MTSPNTRPRSQRGGFALGLVVGLLLGLAMALAVALYVTKVPVPLMNKGQQRTPEQDAAEAQKNKNWDPNAALAGKAASRPAIASAPAPTPDARPDGSPSANAAATPVTTKPVTDNTRPGRDPAAILAGQPDGAGGSGADGFVYFVQVGAYSKPEDAEQQRAKLAIQGYAAKVSERDQNGRTVHRVRLGPFEKRDDAETMQDKVKAIEPEASLVRVERSKQ